MPVKGECCKSTGTLVNPSQLNFFSGNCHQSFEASYILNSILNSSKNVHLVATLMQSRFYYVRIWYIQSKCVIFCTYPSPSPPCQHSHPTTCLNFPVICNLHVVAADLTIPSLNYISIPATVALATAAMVTSQSVQVEWPECGP